MATAPIYVEILIHGSIDELFAKTQDPSLHQTWDLRFSSITYLPRAEGETQLFLYRTRIGAGLVIAGTGESVNTTETDGIRTSTLRFASDDSRSLITKGGGYWKYIPRDDGINFLTRYTYEHRFGIVGGAVDRWCFRPLLGWATAISFDCLRLWIERGIPPDISWSRLRTHVTSRLAVAAIWSWHGLVPKLLYPQAERALVEAAGWRPAAAANVVAAIGVAELIIGACVLLPHRRWPLWLTVAAMAPLAVAACIARPQLVTAPFSPLTLGAGMIALSMIALMTQRDLPSARRCRRTPEIPA